MEKSSFWSGWTRKARENRQKKTQRTTFGRRNLQFESLESRQMLSISPFLQNILDQKTPNPHPTGDVATDGSQSITLTGYTQGDLFYNPGFAEVTEFNNDLQAIYDGVTADTTERPEYWGEVSSDVSNEYKLHFNDNGMLVTQWAINWGDGTAVEKVSDQPWAVHNYVGVTGSITISVVAYSAIGQFSYSVDANGDPIYSVAKDSNALSVNNSTLNSTLDSALDVNDVPSEITTPRPGLQLVLHDVAPSLCVIGDQTTSAGECLSLSEIGTFSHPNVSGNFTYSIDWGDGSCDSGTATATLGDDATLHGSFGGEHCYSFGGNFYATATISDPDGQTDSRTFLVTVNDVGTAYVVDTPADTTTDATTDTTPTNTTTDTTSTSTTINATTEDTTVTVGVIPNDLTLATASGVMPTDAVVLAAIRQALGLAADAAVTGNDMAKLTTLTLDSSKVYSLDGLDNAVNLVSLTLTPSDYSDPGHLSGANPLSPLSGLTKLTTLTLQRCGLTDAMLSTVSGFTALTTLDVRYNNLVVVPASIAALSQLSSIMVYGNPLTDNPRAGLAALAGKMITVDLAPDHPEKALTNIDPANPAATYHEIAAAFYNLPLEIYEYVLNTIDFQAYQGTMKGGLAVLETGAGNDWDVCSLLAGIFQQAGVTSTINYASAQVKENISDAENLLGVKTAKASYYVLASAGLNPHFFNLQNQDITSSLQLLDSSAVYVTFDHTWIETNLAVPGSGTQTILFDPSRKLHDYQDGLGDLLASTAVPFNLDGTGGYLSQTGSSETPSEFYERKVREYLASSDHSELNCYTIADVAYDGAIRQHAITSVPITLESQGYVTSTKTTSTAIPAAQVKGMWVSVAIPQGTNRVTGSNYSSGQTTLIASSAVFQNNMKNTPIVLTLPDGTDATFIIKSVTNSTTVVVDGDARFTSLPFAVTAVTSAVSGIASAYSTADVALRQITIGYTGASTSLTPHIYIDGQESFYLNGVNTGASSLYTTTTPLTVASGAAVKIILRYDPGTSGNQTRAYTQVYTRNAGKYQAVGMDAHQTSDQELADLRKKLNDAEITKANGGTPTDDALLGSLLNLVLANYFQQIEKNEATVCGLTAAVQDYNHVGSGLATCDTTLQTSPNFDLQFPYLPQSLGIDMPSIYQGTLSITASAANSVARDTLLGYDASYMEGAVIEELTNIPSVSTTKSLQLAKTTGGNSVITINHDNAAQIVPGNSSSILANLDSAIQTAIKNYAQGRQNFASFVEVDPNNRLAASGDSYNTLTYSGLTKNEDAYFYTNANDGNFSGSFQHWVDVKCTSAADGSCVNLWELSNLLDDAQGIHAVGGDYLAVRFIQVGTQLKLQLVEEHGGTTVTQEANVSAGTQYYLRIVRDETIPGATGTGTLTLQIYTNSARTGTPLATLSISPQAQVDFKYLLAASSYSASSTAAQSGVVSNLDVGNFQVLVPTQNTNVGNDTSNQWKGVGYTLTNYDGYVTSFLIHGGINGVIEAPHGGFAVGTPTFPQIAFPTFTQLYGSDPINTANGEVMHNETDVSIPNLGVPLTFARSYHSFNTQQTWADRGMGAGWSFTFSDKLEFSGGNVTWFTDSGVRLLFAAKSGGGWTTPAGTFGSLTQSGTDYLWTDTTGKTVRFDSTGKLTAMLDRYNCGVSVSYNGTQINQVQRVLNNAVATGTDASSLTFTYVGTHITSVSDSTGRTWRYDYDSAGRLVAATAPVDSTTAVSQSRYEYFVDTARLGLLKSVTDANGNKTQYAYYANRRGLSVTNAEGNVHSQSYNLYRYQTEFVDERGVATYYSYNKADGNLLQQLNADQTTEEYTWTSGQKTSDKDAYGQTETYEYDARGNMTKLTDRLGHVTDYTYSTTYNNLLTVKRNADNAVTTYTYSSDGSAANDDGLSLWKVQDAIGDSTHYTLYTYNWGASNRGQVLTMTTPKGTATSDVNDYKTVYSYNAAGQTLSRTTRYGSGTGQSILESFSYDSLGRGYLVSSVDGNGNTTECTYDVLGRLRMQRQADPDGGGTLISPITGYSYDAAGNPLTTTLATAALPETTRVEYDKMGRKTKVVNADGTYQTYEYDAIGNLTYQTDELGRVTHYFYDSRNRCVTIIRPDGTTTRTEYTGGGRTESVTDGNGNTTEYTYDKLGRKKTVTLCDPDGTSGSLIAATTQYVYDDANDIQYVVDAIGSSYTDVAHTTTYYFDKLGHKTKEIKADPDGSGPLTRPTTTYTYDFNGNLTTVADPRGHVTTYVYDEHDRKIQQIESDPDESGPLGSLTTSYSYDNNGNLRYVVNPKGTTYTQTAYTTEYQYDSLNRKVKEILPDPGVSGQSAPTTTYSYDNGGNLVSTTNALGAVTSYAYDRRNRLAQTTDALGGVTTTVYDAVGNALLSTDALGRTTQYQYDAMNRVVLKTLPTPDATSAVAPQTKWRYDNNGNTISVLDSRGSFTWTAYDAWNRIVKVTDALGLVAGDSAHTTVTTYDQLGRVWKVTDQLGRTTIYEYDNLGRKTKQTLPDPDDYSAVVTGGANGAQTALITYYGYDSNGNLKYVTDALGAAPNATTSVPDAAHTTWYFYDGLNRLTYTFDALAALSIAPASFNAITPSSTAHSTSKTYDALGNVVSTKDQIGRVTTYTYDNLRRKTADVAPEPTTGAGHPTTTYSYDALGNLLLTTDPLAYKTWNVYDALGRKVRTVDSLGNGPNDLRRATTTSYDAVGNVLGYTDASGNTTTYAYDGLNRQVRETDPLGNVTSYKYDLNGNLVQKIDRNGLVTKSIYDALNRKTEEDSVSGTTVSLLSKTTYDAAGQVITVVDTGATYHYFYDRAGRLKHTRVAPSDVSQTVTPISATLIPAADNLWDWNGDGLKEAYTVYFPVYYVGEQVHIELQSSAFQPALIIARPDGSDKHLYKGTMGSSPLTVDFTATMDGEWLIFVTSPTAGVSGAYSLITRSDSPIHAALTVLDYAYDANGNMTSASDNMGGQNTYQYDAANRLTQETQSDFTAVAANKKVTTKTAAFTYYDDGQLNTITRTVGDTPTTVATTYYQTSTGASGYDGMGRLTDMRNAYGSVTLSYAWTYDADSRVQTMTSPDETSGATVVYDAIDEVKGVDYVNQTDETYSYDSTGNRITSGSTVSKTGAANRVLSDGTYTYEYDKEGNRTKQTKISDGTWIEYQWDYHNRLTLVTYKSSTGTATKIVSYTYDSQGRLIRRGYDSDGAGSTAMTYTYSTYQGDELYAEYSGTSIIPVRRYFNAVDKVLATDDCSRTTSASGVVQWGLDDNEGTIRDVVSGPSTLVSHRKYDAYGKLVSGAVDAAFSFGYDGMRYDSATEMYSTPNRWYDPKVGRWTSEDPSRFGGGDWNLSRYCGNNTINTRDMSGLCSQNVFNSGLSIGKTYYTGADYLSSTKNAFSDSALAMAGYKTTNGGGSSSLSNGLALNTRMNAKEAIENTWTYQDLKAGTNELQSNPWNAINPLSKGNILHLTTVGMIGGTLEMVPTGISAGYSDARYQLANTASTSSSSLIAGAASVGYGMTYPMEVTSQLANGYAGGEMAGLALSPVKNAALSAKAWYYTGAENDAAWQALSLKDKVYYEIGQKTLKDITPYADLSAVERGRQIVQDQGWFTALKPQGAGWQLGVGETFSTGPTPAFRYVVPRAAGAAAAGGATYYLLNQLQSGETKKP